MNDKIGKLAVIGVIIVAFIDGILIANHYNQEAPITSADKLIELEDVFEEVSIEEEAPVPFTTQAPYGDWKSPWSDYSEEAVIYMAMQWARGEEINSVDTTSTALLSIGAWEAENFGDSLDSNLDQILQVITEYFNHPNAYISYDVSLLKLIQEIDDDNLVIIPVNGQLLDNHYYGDPAPEHHMLLLIDYDTAKSQFITNDPGTRFGENYAYDYSTLLNAIRDLDGSKRIIIVEN